MIASDSGNLCHAGVIFQPDGGLDKMQVSLTAQVLNAGQYLSDEPQSAAGNALQVRCSAVNSGAWTAQAASVGTWVDISEERIWRVTVTSMAAPDIESCGATFQLRKGSSGDVHQFTVYAEASN